MILRFQRSLGLRLFRWNKRQIELWLCPAGETIPLHRHPHMDGTIMFLFGRMMFQRNAKKREMRWWHIGRYFSISRVDWHGAWVTGRFGVFMVFERWLCAPSSASCDFERLSGRVDA